MLPSTGSVRKSLILVTLQAAFILNSNFHLVGCRKICFRSMNSSWTARHFTCYFCKCSTRCRMPQTSKQSASIAPSKNFHDLINLVRDAKRWKLERSGNGKVHSAQTFMKLFLSLIFKEKCCEGKNSSVKSSGEEKRMIIPHAGAVAARAINF